MRTWPSHTCCIAQGYDMNQVGYRQTSFHRTAGMSEFLLNYPGVCVRVVYVGRCTECVQVGLLLQFLASWHRCDLCEENSQLQPSSWSSDDLRTEQTERLVLLSLSPSCLPAVVCPDWGTCRAGSTYLKISGWLKLSSFKSFVKT